jgi:hypothetical protein
VACGLSLPALPEYDAGTSLADAADAPGAYDGPLSDVPVSPDDATGDTYPWWLADTGPDSPRQDHASPDIHVPDVGTQDGSAPPPFWDCPVKTPEQLGGGLVHYGSFSASHQVLDDFPPENNLLSPNWLTCGLPRANSQWQDRAFVLQVDEPTEMRLSLDCNGPCYAYTLQGGCLYQYLQSCWFSGEETVDGGTWLLPGLHVLVVEFYYQEGILPSQCQFDIHVALNHEDGQQDCVVEKATRFTDVPLDCPLAPGSAPAISMPSELSEEDGDDFYMDCSPFGRVDPFGGMPDEAFSFTADGQAAFPGPVTLSLTRTTPATGPALMLALSTAPCGAEGSVISCTSGAAETLTLPPVTLFPGQTVYAIVDAVSQAGPAPAWPVPYTLTWTVPDPCPQKTP